MCGPLQVLFCAMGCRRVAIVWLFQVIQFIQSCASLGMENDLEFAEGAAGSAGPVAVSICSRLNTERLNEPYIYWVHTISIPRYRKNKMR